MSDWIAFTEIKLKMDGHTMNSGPGHLKIMPERTDWLEEEFMQAVREWAELPENAKPFRVPADPNQE
jgi:hypothetical protein